MELSYFEYLSLNLLSAPESVVSSLQLMRQLGRCAPPVWIYFFGIIFAYASFLITLVPILLLQEFANDCLSMAEDSSTSTQFQLEAKELQLLNELKTIR
jgi:hypothetical protein